MTVPPIGFWVVHAVGCLACGAFAWGLGLALHKLLRVSHASRSYWLGIWALAVLPTVTAVVFALWAPAPLVSIPATLPLPIAIDPGDLDTQLAASSATGPLAWPSLAVLLATIYLGGVFVALLRSLLGALSVWRMVRATSTIDPAAWPGPAATMEARRLGAGTAVRLTRQSTTPFAVRWPRPTIVLPASALQLFNDRQLQLIIRHEAAHLSQRDPQRVALMKLLGALLWFNPFIRMIATRVQMAAELRCDALALDGDTTAGRDFAGAYLLTLRMTASGSCRAPVTALTHRGLSGHKMRISHMLDGDSGRTVSSRLRAMLAIGALAVGGILAIVQVAAAAPGGSRNNDAPPSSPPVPVTDPARDPVNQAPRPSVPGVQFTHPIASPKITSRFGDAGGIRTRPHRGTDFGARRGTPVLAPAAGLVIEATRQYPDGPNYGTVVVLDHGNGWQTLYAHLDGFDVRRGQRVEAGEQIARVGHTGKATGPHLHLEMLLNGQRVDPEPLLR